jgi:hypothetical protein
MTRWGVGSGRREELEAAAWSIGGSTPDEFAVIPTHGIARRVLRRPAHTGIEANDYHTYTTHTDAQASMELITSRYKRNQMRQFLPVSE